MMECPVCKRNSSNAAAAQAIGALASAYGCTGSQHNPGGFQFSFPFGGRIQISLYCDLCDLETMMARLLEMNNDRFRRQM
jgi:hypothetical protein